MRSTFMGLETNKRGLYTQQSALYTTGHNISNANTKGYSRQRVNMEATSGFPGVGLNTGTMPGFLGTGVQASSIQRIRDGFVDQQFRGESNKLGYWESRTNAVEQMEDVLAEPSEYGLQQSLSDFWKSLQTLASNPENGGARAVVVERGVAVADSFNYIHNSLSDIQKNLGNEIGVSTKSINSILKQVGELNTQIAAVEPNGYMPNDLYDARDNLLDKLSSYLPIDVTYEKSGGGALANAEGSATVKIKTNGEPITVVEKSGFSQLTPVGTGKDGVFTDDQGNPIGDVTSFTITGGPAAENTVDINNMQTSGSLKSLVNSYGYKDSNSVTKGLYPDMLAKLDKMAQEFAKEFNKVHRDGFEQGSDVPGANFFEPYENAGTGNTDYDMLSAGNIKVNQNIKDNPGKLAASTHAEEMGNGNNAKKLGDVLFAPLGGLEGASVQSYYAGVIGELGVQGQQAFKMTENTITLLGAVSNRRDSISSVSLDEEMTDMIRFQQAYNASARMITVVDETLDKIINGMGLAGR